VDGPRERLYEDGRYPTPSGRARFVASPVRATAERASATFPFQLTTPRLRDQWHGMSRSGAVPGLFAHEGAPVLRLHPQDAERRRLANGELLRLRTARGSTVLPLQTDARVGLGQADLPMHWGAEFLAGDGVNALTSGARCPDSQQPELKFAALDVASAALPWRLSACAWVPAAEGAALRERLRAQLNAFPYASCLPVPSNDPSRCGWAFEAAAEAAPEAALLNALTEAVGLLGAGVHRYADAGRGRLRLLRLDGALLQALLRAGEHDEAAWLLPLWRERQSVQALGRWLLGPGTPPQAQLTAPRAAQVCNCFDVREDAITAELRRCSGSADARLAALQGALRCGTQCGSCLPSLRRLVATTHPEEVSA
jgi:assimilatory nitrate reductase catalytic subunit